jgi:hypothetical protein
MKSIAIRLCHGDSEISEQNTICSISNFHTKGHADEAAPTYYLPQPISLVCTLKRTCLKSHSTAASVDPALGDLGVLEETDPADHHQAHMSITVTKKQRMSVLISKSVADQTILAADRGAGGNGTMDLATEEGLEKENLGYRCGGTCHEAGSRRDACG